MQIAKRPFGKGLSERRDKQKHATPPTDNHNETDDADVASRIVPQASRMGGVSMFDTFGFESLSINQKIDKGDMDQSVRFTNGDCSLQLGTPTDPIRVAFPPGPYGGIQKGQKRTSADTAKVDDKAPWTLSVDLPMELYKKYREFEERVKGELSKIIGKSVEVINENWQSSVRYDETKEYLPTFKVSIATSGFNKPTCSNIIAVIKDGKECISRPRPLDLKNVSANARVQIVFSSYRVYISNNKKCGIKWSLDTLNQVLNKSANQKPQPNNEQYATLSRDEEDEEFAKYETGSTAPEDANGATMSSDEVDAQINSNNGVPE